MFARVFALLPLALLASASHLAARDTYSCNTGNTYCCNSESAVGSHQAALGGLGGVVDVVIPLLATVGATCSAVAVDNCSQQPVCCTNVNNYGGLVSADCNSISL